MNSLSVWDVKTVAQLLEELGTLMKTKIHMIIMTMPSITFKITHSVKIVVNAFRNIMPIATKVTIAIFVANVSMMTIFASDVGWMKLSKYVVHAVKVVLFITIASIVINTLISRQAAVATVIGAWLHGIVRTVAM